MANTYIPIATTTVGSGGVSTITFNSIPQTYTDLLIKLSLRSNFANQANGLLFITNGNSSDYSLRVLEGNGSTVGSTNTTYSVLGIINGNSTTVNTFSNVEIYIPNYTSSNNKSFSCDAVTENSGTTAYQYFYSALRSSTAAITSIAFADGTSGQNFMQYSTATLYGIKNS
jgi:hypothetical protein